MVRLKMMVHIFGALKSPIDGIFFVNTPEKRTDPMLCKKQKAQPFFSVQAASTASIAYYIYKEGYPSPTG